MKRLAFTFIVFLLLGVIVNVAVAWGCALRLPPRDQLISYSELDEFYVCLNRHPGSMFTFTQTHNYYYSVGKLLDWHEFHSELPWGSQFRDQQWVIREHNAVQSDVPLAQVAEHAHGWPLLSMRCGYRAKFVSPAAAEAVFVGGVEIGTGKRNRLIPYHILWPGFAINTIFYAAILWVVWFAPGAVRRMIRRRRGLCAACAYPIGTSPVCTECGDAVKQKAETQKAKIG